MRNKELMLKVAKKIDNSKSKSYTKENFLDMFPDLKKVTKKRPKRIVKDEYVTKIKRIDLETLGKKPITFEELDKL